MKLQPYEPQVRAASPKSAAVTASSDVNSYGNAQGNLGQMAKVIDQASAVLEKQWDAEDRISVLKAMDAYNKGRYDIMYNDKDGLMYTQAEAASGISQAYLKKNADLRSQVLGNTKLHKKTNLAALENLMDNAGRQGFETVDKWQYKQGEVVKDNALNNTLTGITTLLQKDYSNPGAVDNALLNARLMISARYGEEVGRDFLEGKYRLADEQILSSTISAAIAQDNFEAANQLLLQYGDRLAPQQKNQFTSFLQQRGNQNHLFRLGQMAAEMFPNDEQKAIAWLQVQNGWGLGDQFNRHMDEAEVNVAHNYYLNFINTNKRLRNEYENNRTMEFSEQLYKLYKEGKTYDEAMKFARDYAQSDAELNKKCNSVVASFYGKNNNQNRMSVDELSFQRYMLSLGKYPTLESYLNAIAACGGSEAQKGLAIKDYEDWRHGRGQFKYTGAQLLSWGMDAKSYSKLKPGPKSIMEKAVQEVVAPQIADYVIKHKEYPSISDVQTMCKTAMTWATISQVTTEGKVWDSTIEASPALLRSVGIIAQPVSKGNYTVEVTFENGKVIMPTSQLEAMLKGNSDMFEDNKYEE